MRTDPPPPVLVNSFVMPDSTAPCRDIHGFYVLMPDYDVSELYWARGLTIPEVEADAAAYATRVRRAWEGDDGAAG